MATEETIWKSITGSWGSTSSWTNGIPSIGAEPTVARFSPEYSNKDVRLDLTGATCQRLIIEPGCSANIGGIGAPLELEIGDLGIHRGTGKVVIEFDSGGFSNFLVDSPNRVEAAVLSGVLGRLAVKSGKTRVKNGSTIAYQTIANGELANLVIEGTSGSMSPVVAIDAGSIENFRQSPSGNYRIFAAGGKLIQRGPLVSGDLVFTGPGAIFNYLPSSEPASNPQLILLNGYSNLEAVGFQIGVDKNIIGQWAEVAGSSLESGGYPPGSLSEPIDLREDYP